MARPRRDGAASAPPNKQKLSHFHITNLRPREKPYTVWDVTQKGLAVVMQPTGNAAWKCIYSYHGRPRWIHLADVKAIGLAAARKLASEFMYQVAQGKDPAADKRAARTADTFEDLATRYRKYSQTKNKSWSQADKLVRKNLLPKWGKLAAASITRGDVKALLETIDAPILANQVLSSASAIFTWAIRQDVAGIAVNPCIGIERNKTSKRERVLSDAEVPLFWSAFETAGVEGAALKALLLCGQRPGEVANMRTEHIAANWWGMPGEPVPSLDWPGTKNAESHRVWLPTPLQKIIKNMDADGRVFEITTNQLSSTMRIICAELDVARATPHDLRRTHGTTITGLGYGRDAMNRIQNHREGGIADVYDQFQYADENKTIMEAVAARVMQLAAPRRRNKKRPR
jgi:integrase